MGKNIKRKTMTIYETMEGGCCPSGQAIINKVIQLLYLRNVDVSGVFVNIKILPFGGCWIKGTSDVNTNIHQIASGGCLSNASASHCIISCNPATSDGGSISGPISDSSNIINYHVSYCMTICGGNSIYGKCYNLQSSSGVMVGSKYKIDLIIVKNK